MERPPHPTPINPYAKYLSNSISNVLYSIQKFDQGTLAWPTGPRKRNVWTKPMCRCPPGVPLAGTGSCLISNSRPSRSKQSEGVDKKNAFYQILQASQDQPNCVKSAGRSRVDTKREFNPDNDRIYNDIYDIVKTHLQGKRHPKPEENQPQRPDTPKVRPPVLEIYKVRRRDTETTTQQKPSKGKKSKRKSQHSRKESFQIRPEMKKRREQPRKDVDKSEKALPKTKIPLNNSKETAWVQHYSSTVPIPDSKNNSKLHSKVSFSETPIVERIVKNCNETRKKHRNSTGNCEENSAGRHPRPNDSGKEQGPSKVKSNPIGKSPMKEVFRILERPNETNEKEPDEALTKPKPPTLIPEFLSEEDYMKLTRSREEDIQQKNVKEDTARKPTEPKIKTKPASGWKLRVFKVEKAEKPRKMEYKRVDQKPSVAAFTPANEKSSIASEVVRDGFESPAEMVQFRTPRTSLDPRRLMGSLASRKAGRNSTDDYQEKLRKVKMYLNKHAFDDGSTENSSLDLEGIHDRDLLGYPYSDIFKRNSMTEVKDNGVENKQNKPKPKQKPPEKEVKPPEVEKECKGALRKKSCCICRAIRCPGKDAPFLEEMRKAQRRQELLAYRANMAMGNKPSKGSPRARQLGINDLDKKLYSLEDRYIVFTRERNLNTRPKRSNSTIFSTPSKRITFLKRCNSFIFPKESSSIICS